MDDSNFIRTVRLQVVEVRLEVVLLLLRAKQRKGHFVHFNGETTKNLDARETIHSCSTLCVCVCVLP